MLARTSGLGDRTLSTTMFPMLLAFPIMSMLPIYLLCATPPTRRRTGTTASKASVAARDTTLVASTIYCVGSGLSASSRSQNHRRPQTIGKHQVHQAGPRDSSHSLESIPQCPNNAPRMAEFGRCVPTATTTCITSTHRSSLEAYCGLTNRSARGYWFGRQQPPSAASRRRY